MIRQTVLTAAYRYISRRLCEVRGHDWREIDVRVDSSMNLAPVEECRTCECRRVDYSAMWSTSTTRSTNDAPEWPNLGFADDTDGEITVTVEGSSSSTVGYGAAGGNE